MAALSSLELTSLVGRICVPDDKGVCDGKNMSINPIRLQNAVIKVVPPTDVLPEFHAVITKKYAASLGIPIFKAADEREYVDEMTGKTVATATFQSDFKPTATDIVKQLPQHKLRLNPKQPYIFYISSAAVYMIGTKRHFFVKDTAGVNYSGIGAEGNTYNAEDRQESVPWILITGTAIDVRDQIPKNARIHIPAANTPIDNALRAMAAAARAPDSSADAAVPFKLERDATWRLVGIRNP